MEPRVVNGWFLDEEPGRDLFGNAVAAVTATHMLSGVVLTWADDTNNGGRIAPPPHSPVHLDHPSGKCRPISGHILTQEEARAYIERVIADA